MTTRDTLFAFAACFPRLFEIDDRPWCLVVIDYRLDEATLYTSDDRYARAIADLASFHPELWSRFRAERAAWDTLQAFSLTF